MSFKWFYDTVASFDQIRQERDTVFVTIPDLVKLNNKDKYLLISYYDKHWKLMLCLFLLFVALW